MSNNDKFMGKVKKYRLEIIFATILLSVVTIGIFGLMENKPSLTYKEFIQAVEDEKVDHVIVTKSSPEVTVNYKDGVKYTILNYANLGYNDFIKDLHNLGVDDIRITDTNFKNLVEGTISFSITLLLFYVIIKLLMRSVNMVKEDDNFDLENSNLATFDDVAGMTEEKQELISAIKSLTHHDEFKDKGLRPIRGVLLEGDPGVGKTLLARAVAGEANVNFLSYSATSFSAMFIGVASMRVRQMFKKARAKSPCVIFIDEIDSIGSRRSGRDDSASRENNNMLTTLLENMDGINTEEGILIIGATNRVENLDEALLRSGRFDKVIHISPPKTHEDREAIIQVHLRDKQLEEGITLKTISKLCYGLTGAQIESVLNDSVMSSIVDDREGIISIKDIDEAVMKVHVKGIRKDYHSKEELKRVAYHEAGHAVMNLLLGRDVLKISAQPYSSGVGGVTIVDLESSGSQNLRTKEELIGDIKVLYAGTIVEKLFLGDTSVGNSSDLERATALIHNIVSTWGMEDRLLSMRYFSKENGFLMTEEKIIDEMEKLAREIYQSVEKEFENKKVALLVEDIVHDLLIKEVIYDIKAESLRDTLIRV